MPSSMHGRKQLLADAEAAAVEAARLAELPAEEDPEMRPDYVRIPGATPDAATLETKKLADQLGPICAGVLLAGVAVGTAQTAIPHGLGAGPTSCQVTPRADARVWQPALPDAVNIYLQASVAVTCDVWVF
jgi:hypothetical protein